MLEFAQFAVGIMFLFGALLLLCLSIDLVKGWDEEEKDEKADT